jgi:hypothetical protein
VRPWAVAATESGRPVFIRGYVTITRLVTPYDPTALRAYRVAGRDAQHAFCGEGGVERLSVLHRLAWEVAA